MIVLPLDLPHSSIKCTTSPYLKDGWPAKTTHGVLKQLLNPSENIENKLLSVERKDGAVVKALASNQCGLGSFPGLGVMCGLSLLLVQVLAPAPEHSPITIVAQVPGLSVICGLSLLLVLVLASPERFFSGYSGFSSPLKKQHIHIPILRATSLSVVTDC